MNEYIKIVVLLTLTIGMIGCVQKERERKFIAVNLVGYPSNEVKEAFLVNTEAEDLVLFDENTDQNVAELSYSIWKEADVASGDKINVIDFSDFVKEGVYSIRSAENENIRSGSFKISGNPYEEVAISSIQSFYYHRCGLGVKNGTDWGYNICHIDDATFYHNKNDKKEVWGGWHDAGDYNKFSVNTSLSAALLLYLYEDMPDKFSDGQLRIPENRNSVPDILDEVKWAMNWLIRMQKHNGAVYHKVSQEKWIGEYLPTEDPSERFIFKESSGATASFAASAALAARLYSEFNKAYSDSLRSSALKAWEFLENNPQSVPLGGFKNPPNVFGGEYGDSNDTDERIWAAIELYRLTGESKFLRYIEIKFKNLPRYGVQPISWRNVNSLALSSLLKIPETMEPFDLKELARERLISQANNILKTHERNNYKNLVKHTEYYWGSNSVGLAYAYDLIKGYELTNNEKYLNAAFDQLHFVLGRNPVNRSQVTAVGSRSVMKPYHQLSELDSAERPVPGMLVGGPNNHSHLNGNAISSFPAKNYEDVFKNYLVNEVAINYTAILAYVSGYLAFKN